MQLACGSSPLPDPRSATAATPPAGWRPCGRWRRAPLPALGAPRHFDGEYRRLGLVSGRVEPQRRGLLGRRAASEQHRSAGKDGTPGRAAAMAASLAWFARQDEPDRERRQPSSPLDRPLPRIASRHMLAAEADQGAAPCALAPSFLPSRSSWRRSAPGPPTSWSGGRRASTPRRTRRSGRSSPPSSRRPASRSSSTSAVAGRDRGQDRWPRSRPGSRPTSCSASTSTTTTANGPTRTGWSTSRTWSARSRTCSIRTRSSCATLLDATTGRRGLYALPMGLVTNHVHVWKSLLERAGLHPRRHPEGVGGVLVVLVRPGAAGGAQGHRPRRHLGRRPGHVGRGGRHRRPSSGSSWRPTRPTT